MKILIVKDTNERCHKTTLLKQIERAITGPDTEYDVISSEHLTNICVLEIKRVRSIPIPKSRKE